jgi:Zn-dependent protease
LLIWVVAAFVSIVVHELGHALAQRRYGGQPRITLYALGGMASAAETDTSSEAQIAIALAGPGAGFTVAAALAAAMWLAGRVVGWTAGGPIELAVPVELDGVRLAGLTVYWQAIEQPAAAMALRDLMFVNIVWGAVNLLPIYPLDGGRVSRELCQIVRGPRRGIVLSLMISMAAAGLMAAYGLTQQSLYLALFFGYLAYQSYLGWNAYRTSSY